jgi:hypothetical protein
MDQTLKNYRYFRYLAISVLIVMTLFLVATSKNPQGFFGINSARSIQNESVSLDATIYLAFSSYLNACVKANKALRPHIEAFPACKKQANDFINTNVHAILKQ